MVKLFGNWGWAPNTAGIHWFLEQVWPAVHEATGATCEIAGTGVPPELRSLAGVVAHGRVPHLQGFLSDAWAIVVPVQNGVGAPVKIAEALAAGVPVLASEDGAPGHREMARASDEIGDWTATLTAWLSGPTPPHALTPSERATRLDALTWATATRPLEEWISSHG